MNGWLLDVNVLLGCGWRIHSDHEAVLGWLSRAAAWAACPITELGFVRVSMTVGYNATFEDARRSLLSLRSLPGHRFVFDDIDAGTLPVLGSHKDTTDAHLVVLAKRHGLKLATLDEALMSQPWAAGVAENPLVQRKGS